MVKIKIASSNLDRLEAFYIHTLEFRECEDGLKFPHLSEETDILLNIIHDRSPRSKETASLASRVYFTYSVSSNFLSYCQRLIDRGVQFEIIGSTPGGFAARAKDLDGNTFEIECSSFEEEDNSVSPENWPSYRRY